LIKGVPQFSRTVNLGTWEFREVLSRTLDLPANQATSLLQSLTPSVSGAGAGAEDQSFSGRGVAALRRVLTELAEEIQRSLDFYLSQGNVAPVAQVLLAGSGANISQLDQFLSQRLTLPVTQINPLSILALPENSIPEESRAGVGIALGLGLRSL
jgi:type IV pilus assembly protein PilM